jgi:ABC-type branched-subunit amino acid transport system substrate-binding protein
MPSVLDDLRAQVEATTAVEASAVVLLNGIGGRIQAAVDAALANGATAEQLAPVTDEVTALTNATNDLSAAVTANTPVAPPA